MKLTALAIIAFIVCSVSSTGLRKLRGALSAVTLVENDVINALKKYDNDMSK